MPRSKDPSASAHPRPRPPRQHQARGSRALPRPHPALPSARGPHASAPLSSCAAVVAFWRWWWEEPWLPTPANGGGPTDAVTPDLEEPVTKEPRRRSLHCCLRGPSGRRRRPAACAPPSPAGCRPYPALLRLAQCLSGATCTAVSGAAAPGGQQPGLTRSTPPPTGQKKSSRAAGAPSTPSGRYLFSTNF